jgi:hypothetical protein
LVAKSYEEDDEEEDEPNEEGVAQWLN